jgi:integrase
MPAKKAKTYVGRVYLGQDEDGRQLWHWVGRFERKRDRDEAVARARTEKPWEKDVAPDEWTVDAWADRVLARMESGDLRTRGGRRYKDSSIDTARSSLRTLRAEFGLRALSSITRVEAEDWAAKVPPSKIPIAVTLFEQARLARLVDRNEFERLSKRSEGRRNERPPSEEEMLLLLDGCSALGDEYAPMMRAMLTFGAFTIMRPGELFAVDWEDIDLRAGACGRVRVQRRLYRGRTDLPTSNKERTITLVPPAREALDSLLAVPGYYPHGLVFRNKTGGQLTEPTLTAYWKEVRARSRIDCDFYTATKHYGVWYLKVMLGLPDAVIAAQAGWSERSVAKMVETYAHAVDERRLDEIDAAFQTQIQTQASSIPHGERR